MKLAGISRYLEPVIAYLFAVLGALLMVAGLALFLYQGYLRMNLGVWAEMPASSLFIESDIPADGSQIGDYLKNPTLNEPLPAALREYITHKKLYAVVPDWFKSDTSWLAKAQYLHGLHDIVIRILKFLSIAGFLLLAGAFFMGIGLTKPRSEGDWERREPTL